MSLKPLHLVVPAARVHEPRRSVKTSVAEIRTSALPLHDRCRGPRGGQRGGRGASWRTCGGPFPPGGAASSLSGRFLAMPGVIDAALEAERRSLQEVLISGGRLFDGEGQQFLRNF